MIGFVNGGRGAVTAAAYTCASQVRRGDRVSSIARSGVRSGLIVTGLIAALICGIGDLIRSMFPPPGSEALPVARHTNDRVLWGFVLFGVTFIHAADAGLATPAVTVADHLRQHP